MIQNHLRQCSSTGSGKRMLNGFTVKDFKYSVRGAITTSCLIKLYFNFWDHILRKLPQWYF